MRNYKAILITLFIACFLPGCQMPFGGGEGKGGIVESLYSYFIGDLLVKVEAAAVLVTQQFTKLKEEPVMVVIRNKETHAVMYQQNYDVKDTAGTFKELIPFILEPGKSYEISLTIGTMQTPWKPF